MSKDLSKDFDLNTGGEENNPDNPKPSSVISWISATLTMTTSDIISALTPGWTQGPGYTENEDCW